jgi:gliding motility-associated-like protein
MRYFICFALCIFISGSAKAQIDQKNRKPRIVGQNAISTNEEQPVTIVLGDLTVRDQDDWFYPWGFTLTVYGGDNYTLNNNTVIPAANFSGILSVRVTVNDGENDSDPYDLQIAVNSINDPPVITAQNGSLTTDHNQPIDILLSHVAVSDPDNPYPSGFTLKVFSSSNNSYSVSGNNRVIPAEGFSGTLSVPVQVNDGRDGSNIYSLSIEVKPGNKPPVITGQAVLTINEDEPLLIQLSHLTVTDPDNSYPAGFQLHIASGEAYTLSGATVTPLKDFYGVLSVSVSVNDGTSESNTFAIKIQVRPVNDAPEITRLEAEPLKYQIGQGTTFITTEFEVKDADNDSLLTAEIGFKPEHYRLGFDELSFLATSRLKGSFDLQRGLLVISGKATASEYIEAVRTVRYEYITAGEPVKENKTIFFRLSDGTVMSEIKEREITSSEVVVKFDIPTAFTPNGDSANDTWRIQPVKQQDEKLEVVLRVYNRFGKLLFETAGFEKEWDGKLNGDVLPADTYYYTIDFKEEYSRNSVKGIVAILR